LAKPPLRERLIGTLVILCLALIFYPLLFVSQDEFEISRDSVIPERQIEVEPLNIVEPVAPYEVREVVLHELFNPDENTDEVDPEDITDQLLNESGLPNAWVIQVGSFAQKENADALNQDLTIQGYESYVKLTPSFDEDPDLYKVYVGPILNSDETKATFARLNEQLQNQAILLHFEP
jgi:DedD protein